MQLFEITVAFENNIGKPQQIEFFLLANHFFKKLGYFNFLIDKNVNRELLNEIRNKLTINFNEKSLENRFNINFDVFFYNMISCMFINCFSNTKDLLHLWDMMLIFSNIGYIKEFIVSSCVTFFWFQKGNVDKCKDLMSLQQIFNKPLDKGSMFSKKALLVFKEIYGISSLNLLIKHS